MALVAPAAGFDLQGHRGARGLAPENTLVGFATALTIGVTTLELDTGISADGVVVISHDRRLKADKVRLPSGGFLAEDGPPLRELKLAELRTYRLSGYRPGSRDAERFPDVAEAPDQTIPTLDELRALLETAEAAEVRLNIETKLSPMAPAETVDPDTFAETLVATLRRTGLNGRATVQSFDWRTLQAVQRLAPEIPTAYLSIETEDFDTIRRGETGASPWTAGFDIDAYDGLPAMIKDAGGDVWSPYFRNLTPEKVLAAQAMGLQVIPWTVNSPPDMERLIDMEVDGLITDYPDRLRAVLYRRGMALPEPMPVAP